MTFGSWQIFEIAKVHLPKGRLFDIFTQTTRSVYRWAANPRACAETSRNPIDRIRMLLDEINIAGYGEYARAAIDYMAEPLGGRFTDAGMAVSDKGTVDGEIGDATIAIGRLSEVIRAALEDNEMSSVERIKVKGAARAAMREIEQLLDVSGVNNGGQR